MPLATRLLNSQFLQKREQESLPTQEKQDKTKFFADACQGTHTWLHQAEVSCGTLVCCTVPKTAASPLRGFSFLRTKYKLSVRLLLDLQNQVLQHTCFLQVVSFRKLFFPSLTRQIKVKNEMQSKTVP